MAPSRTPSRRAEPAAGLLSEARRISESLRARAEQTDLTGVRRTDLDALGSAGLLAELPVAARREVTELLAAADCSTWLVSAQHATPLRLVADAGHPGAAGLSAGSVHAGVAFSHLRAYPRAPVTARTVGAGSVELSGNVAWCSGWGLVDVLAIAAVSPSGEVIFGLVEAREQPGLAAGAPLALAALQGTATVPLVLDRLRIGAGDVLLRQSYAQWRAGDDAHTADASPALFGLTRELLGELGGREAAAGGAAAGGAAAGGAAGPAAARAAAGMERHLEDLRQRAYAAADGGAPLAERRALRAESVELAWRAAAAVVVNASGRGLVRTARPQRLAREVMFLSVQAQTGAVRDDVLSRLTGNSAATGAG